MRNFSSAEMGGIFIYDAVWFFLTTGIISRTKISSFRICLKRMLTREKIRVCGYFSDNTILCFKISINMSVLVLLKAVPVGLLLRAQLINGNKRVDERVKFCYISYVLFRVCMEKILIRYSSNYSDESQIFPSYFHLLVQITKFNDAIWKITIYKVVFLIFSSNAMKRIKFLPVMS